jgi:hypothetical protein
VTPLRNRIRVTVGGIAARLAPHLVREIEAGVHTGHNIRLKRWIMQAQAHAALTRGSEAELSRVLMTQWQAQDPDAFYDKYSDRFREWFFGPHKVIIDETVALAPETPFRLLVEPLAPDHDLDRDEGSHIFGLERSFSHNYAALLSEAGLQLRYRNEVLSGGVRWIMMLAQGPGQVSGRGGMAGLPA